MLIRNASAKLPITLGVVAVVVAMLFAAIRMPDRDHLAIWFGLAGNHDVPAGRVLSRWLSRLGDASGAVAVPAVEIEVRFADFLTIREDRARALETGVLLNAREVPGRLSSADGERMPIRLRLKGDLYPHWEDANRWSLRIEFKRGTSLNGFSVLSLQQAGNRQFPDDQLFQYWLRQVGLATPRFQFLRVRVNGEDWGVMLAEEHMSHQFLERNRRREGAIVKFGNELDWYYRAANRGVADLAKLRYSAGDISLYGESRYRDDDRMRGQYARATAIAEAVEHGDRGALRMLDTGKFATALAAALAWGSTHTLHYPNSRFYLNPFTLRLEPVTTDQAYAVARNSRARAPDRVPRLYRLFAGDADFEDAFRRALDALANTLPGVTEEHQRLCGFVPLDCPDFDVAIVQDNLERIREEPAAVLERTIGRRPPGIHSRKTEARPPTPAPAGVDFPLHLRARYFEDGTLRLVNPLPHEVRVEDIVLECVERNPCQAVSLIGEPLIVAPGRTGAHPLARDVRLDPGMLTPDQRLRIQTRVGDSSRVTSVSLVERSDPGSPLVPATVVPGFFEREDDGYRVPRGTWPVRSPVILPAGARLVLSPGTTIRFGPEAFLIVRGALLARGTSAEPIRLEAAGEAPWKGIYVMEAQQRSRLEHVEILNTTNTSDGALELTGAFTFYQADADLRDVSSVGSIAEDAFNFVDSDFSMERVRITNTQSDAIDSDFCTGRLRDLVFRDIGGDGLDTSGSVIQAGVLRFDGIGDKALSIGEGSRASVTDVTTRDVGIAAVSKDASRLSITGMSVRQARLHTAMAYTKKSYFGPATLEIDALESDAEPGVVAQTGSRIIIDGKDRPTMGLDVRALYRSGPMRKH